MAHQLVCSFFSLHKHLTNIWAEDLRLPDTPCRCTMSRTLQSLPSNQGEAWGGLLRSCRNDGMWWAWAPGELCSLSLTLKAGQTAAHLHQTNMTLAAPAQAYLTVTDEAVCRGVGRGGGVSPERGVAINPRRNSGSLGTRLSASQEEAPPGQGTRREGGGGSVSTHFHTWTNSKTRQGKQPTHLYPPSPPLLLLPRSKKTRYLGRHRLPPDLFRSGPPRASRCSLSRADAFVRSRRSSQLFKSVHYKWNKKGRRRRKEFTFWYGKEKRLSLDASRVHQR